MLYFSTKKKSHKEGHLSEGGGAAILLPGILGVRHALLAHLHKDGLEIILEEGYLKLI